MDAYRRLAAAGDIKAAQKLAALTGEGDLATKGTTTVNHLREEIHRELLELRLSYKVCHSKSL